MKIKQPALLILPGLTILWAVLLNLLSGPHFLSRTDPEYVYLLNGMNVALLQLDRIGHVDHPGTPFQLLTGLFIRIIYLFSGGESLFQDVLSHPEKYLFGSSLLLSLLTGYVLYWASKVTYKHSGSFTGALILPASLFLFAVVADFYHRYIPDRLLVLVVVWFSVTYIQYRFLGLSEKKFATLGGIILAVGVITKINFIPFVVLPFFLLQSKKSKIRYLLVFLLAGALLILPIYHKLDHFWRFAVSLATHDGLYGSGSPQIMNADTVYHNLGLIVRYNPVFALLFLGLLFISTRYIGILFHQSSRRRDYLLILGVLVVWILSVFLVAKHYKNYYLAPVFVSSGLIIYFGWVRLRDRTNALRSAIPVFLLIAVGVIHSAILLVPGYQQRIEVKNRGVEDHAFIQQTVSNTDFLLIEPTWMAGPSKMNGLVYGMAYMNHRALYFLEYEHFFPNNVLTYEGLGNPFKYLSLIEADDEWVFKSGKDLYCIASPGRNTGDVIASLTQQALRFNIGFSIDTVYSNEKDGMHLLRFRNLNPWKVKGQFRCGFEHIEEGAVYTDEGALMLQGSFELMQEEKSGGQQSIVLGKNRTRSPAFVVPDVHRGDYILAEIKRKKGKEARNGKLVLEYTDAWTGQQVIAEGNASYRIHSDWELVRAKFPVNVEPEENTVRCFYIHLGASLTLDDFSIKHCSNAGN